MIEFFLTFLIFGLVVAAMAIGVIYGRNPIAGSCGGLNNLGIEGGCEICGGDLSKCEEADRSADRDSKDFYNAA